PVSDASQKRRRPHRERFCEASLTTPTEDSMMATPTDVPAATPSTDGRLIDRVQQLRLNGTLPGGAATARRGSWLPWVLCGVMAVAWVGFGVRGYRNADKTGGEGVAKSGAKNAAAETAAPAPGELLL